MRNFPTDPMRQYNRFVAAFCDDLFDMVVTGNDPKSRDRIAAISRHINQSTRGMEVLAQQGTGEGQQPSSGE